MAHAALEEARARLLSKVGSTALPPAPMTQVMSLRLLPHSFLRLLYKYIYKHGEHESSSIRHRLCHGERAAPAEVGIRPRRPGLLRSLWDCVARFVLLEVDSIPTGSIHQFPTRTQSIANHRQRSRPARQRPRR